MLLMIDTCCPAEATTGVYATVTPTALPLGEGDTVLGVPDGLLDAVDVPDAVVEGVDGVLVADAGSDGLAESVADGDAASVEDDDALAGVPGEVVLAVLDPLEHAASTNGRVIRASVMAGRAPRLRWTAVTVRSSFNGMGSPDSATVRRTERTSATFAGAVSHLCADAVPWCRARRGR